MGRNEIIKQLAERIYGNTTSKDLQECASFCDALVDIFTDALVNDKRIIWKGFLSAEVAERAERKGRNPQTDEVVTFPAVKTVNCKISKQIKDAINNR